MYGWGSSFLEVQLFFGKATVSLPQVPALPRNTLRNSTLESFQKISCVPWPWWMSQSKINTRFTFVGYLDGMATAPVSQIPGTQTSRVVEVWITLNNYINERQLRDASESNTCCKLDQCEFPLLSIMCHLWDIVGYWCLSIPVINH